MLDHPNIIVWLGADYTEVRRKMLLHRPFWTGSSTEFFCHRLGCLPHWLLCFVHETPGQEWFQFVGTVNHPQTAAYPRITGYEHLMDQMCPRTSSTYDYHRGRRRILLSRTLAAEPGTLQASRVLADAEPDRWSVGRLATCRCLNLDQVVGQALAAYQRIKDALPGHRMDGLVLEGQA